MILPQTHGIWDRDKERYCRCCHYKRIWGVVCCGGCWAWKPWSGMKWWCCSSLGRPIGVCEGLLVVASEAASSLVCCFEKASCWSQFSHPALQWVTGEMKWSLGRGESKVGCKPVSLPSSRHSLTSGRDLWRADFKVGGVCLTFQWCNTIIDTNTRTNMPA